MAMAFVSIVTPPFDAQYAARSFMATSPSTDPIFTMAPPPHFRNSGSTARDVRNGPFVLTAITTFRAAHVALHRQPRAALLLDFANHLSQLFQPSSCHGHARAFPRKRKRDCSTNACTATGNQRHLAGKSCHGIPFPRV